MDSAGAGGTTGAARRTHHPSEHPQQIKNPYAAPVITEKAKQAQIKKALEYVPGKTVEPAVVVQKEAAAGTKWAEALGRLTEDD